jgi:hypothetical protein
MVNSVSKRVDVAGTDAAIVKYIYNDLGERATTASFVIVPNLSVATHASNYITLTVKKGATTLATFTTNSSGGAAMTAGTPITMTLGASGVGTALELADGGVFTVDVAKAGTGPAYDFGVSCKLQGIRQ